MGALDVRVGVREVRTGTSAMEYDWDAENVRHIARHDVEPYEAEEAVEDPRCVGAGWTSRRHRHDARRKVAGGDLGDEVE